MKIPFNKEWMLLEKEDYANYLFVATTWAYYTSGLLKKWSFIPGRYFGAEYINSACNLFVKKEEYNKTNKIYFQMFFTNQQAWNNLHKLTEVNANKLFKFGGIVKKKDPQKMSNKQLLKIVDDFQWGQALVHCPRGPIFLLETPNNLISNYLHNYLEEKYADVKSKFKPFEAFQILTTPVQESNWAKEKRELARLALIKNNSLKMKYLVKHAQKYEWLEYGLQGKILDFDYFKQELCKMEPIAGKYLSDAKKELVNLARKQKVIFKEYKIHDIHKKIFKIVQDSLYTRLYAKDSQFFGYYCMERIFKEVGRRCGLTLEQVRFLGPEDFKEILIKGKDYSIITTERQKYSAHISDKGKTVYYYGVSARRLMKNLRFVKLKTEIKDTGVLKGQPAFHGKITGRVKIINTIQEMAKIHAGNILVSHMTNPGIVPAMKLAAAIVTDLGGITCHAAIIARELKKPCVIGTKIATKILKDGDSVEVDAERGTVKKI